MDDAGPDGGGERRPAPGLARRLLVGVGRGLFWLLAGGIFLDPIGRQVEPLILA